MNSKTNFVVTRSLFLGLIACAVPALSQSVKPLVITQPTQAGEYQFTQYDKGALESQFLKLLETRSKEDRDYFLNVVNQIEAQFLALQQNEIYGVNGLKPLNVAAVARSEFVPVEKLIIATDRYNLARITLETKINSLTSIAGALPSIDVPSGQAATGKVAAYGNINFASLKDFYANQLAAADRFVGGLKFNYIAVNGISRRTITGLTIVEEDIMMTPEKLQEMEQLARNTRKWNSQQATAMEKLTTTTRVALREFIRKLGEAERYRFANATYNAQVAKSGKELWEYFWARSYMRAMYGMPISTIGMNYDKKKLNREYFTSTNNLQFYPEPIWVTVTNSTEVEDNYRNLLILTEARTQQILSGDASLLQRINSALTFITGNTKLAVVNEAVVRLLAADFAEEKLISSAGGFLQLRDFYRTRYYADPTVEKDIKERLIPAYDRDAADEAGGDNAFADVGGAVTGSFQDAYLNALTHQRTKETELDLARDLESQLRLYKAAANSKAQQGRSQRRREL